MLGQKRGVQMASNSISKGLAVSYEQARSAGQCSEDTPFCKLEHLVWGQPTVSLRCSVTSDCTSKGVGPDRWFSEYGSGASSLGISRELTRSANPSALSHTPSDLQLQKPWAQPTPQSVFYQARLVVLVQAEVGEPRG